MPTCEKRPSRITATWSAKDSASAWSCVTRIVVMPAASRSSATASRMLARSPVSSAENGSSSSISRGCRAMARASATRCCWPPDSWCGRRRRIDCVEPDHVGELGDAPRPVRLGPVQAEADIVGDAEMREQGAILRHDADAAPMRRNRMLRRRPAPRRRARCGRRPAPRSRRSGAAASSCQSPTGRRWRCG